MATAMRLRCIHTCMVLTVFGLLLVYSAFLTTSSYQESSSDGGGEILTSGTSALRLFSAGNYSLPGFLPLPDTSVPQPLPPSETASSPFVPPQERSSAPLTVDGDYSSGRSRSEGSQADLINPTLIQGAQTLQGQPSSPLIEHLQSQRLPLTAVIAKTAPPPPPRRLPADPASKNAVWTRDIYEPGFINPNPGLCPADGADIRLIILITSAPGHFTARDAIRLTWGHFSQRTDVSMAFVLGRTENETLLERLELEKRLYDDLIIASFIDSYDNLTLKTMASMEWIDAYCNQSDFVLKTDDDMFINVPNLLAFIDKIEEGDRKEPKFYGRLARKWKPVRNKKSKYYISFQQFRKTVYPDFTTGPAYLFSSRIARPLFDKGMEKTYLKLEDVFTTGIVAQELGIKRMNIGDFANKKVNFHKTGFCALNKLISMHMVAYHEQFELWKKILDQRTKCKVIYSAKSTLPSSSAAPSNASVSLTSSSGKTIAK